MSGIFNRLTEARHGRMVYNRFDVYVGRALEVYGEYSEAEVMLFREVCRPGFVVMDIGANLGAHTLAFSRLVGESGFVIALEPQQVVFQTLCANMAINSIANVQCLPYAAGEKNGFVRLPYFKYDVEGNFGGISLLDWDQGVRTPVVRLDWYFEDLWRLDFIKIDVEGMEAEVLRGAEGLIEKYRPILYVENDKPDKSKDLIQLIVSMGYRAYWHLPHLFNPDNFRKHDQDLWPGIISSNMFCAPREAAGHPGGLPEIDPDSDFHPFKKEEDEACRSENAATASGA